MSVKYDFIIIGGGAAAFAAAIKADDLGAKALMVNSGLPLGGTCVNVGCVPSKAMLKAAELVHKAQYHKFQGITLKVEELDYPAIVQEELDLVEAMRQKKYASVLDYLKNVEFIEGKAKFVSEGEIEVNNQKIQGQKFLIATGSTAIISPIEGIDKIKPLTHIEALKLKKLPESLLVIGAGPVGLEFSQLFGRFGVKVTLLQKRDRLFPATEPELSASLAKYLSEEGVEIHVNAETQSVKIAGDKKIFTVKVGQDLKEFTCHEVLIASGKRPNTDDLNLGAVGVKVNKRAAVVVKETFVTDNSNIYAAGDVADLPMRLETTAGKEGTLAAENALDNAHKTIDYNSVPYTIFTDPELAGVGLTDAQVIKQGIKCNCGTVPFTEVPKSHVIRDTRGLIKMVIDKETNQIRGVHILAPSAGDLIHEATLAVKFKLKTDDIIDTLHVFPTLSEALKIAAQSFTADISKLSCCV